MECPKNVKKREKELKLHQDKHVEEEGNILDNQLEGFIWLWPGHFNIIGGYLKVMLSK